VYGAQINICSCLRLHILVQTRFASPGVIVLAVRMFFVKDLTHRILLHPSYFGPHMEKFLENKLYADFEGTCSGAYGYIIAVLSILDIGQGNVMSGSVKPSS